MDNAPRRYQLASLFLSISGIAHIVIAGLSGLQIADAVFLGIGVAYLLLAYLMQAGRRWIAYFVFIFMLVGAVGAYMMMPSKSGIIQIAYQVIIAADIACAFMLFILLWRRKNPVVLNNE